MYFSNCFVNIKFDWETLRLVKYGLPCRVCWQFCNSVCGCDNKQLKYKAQWVSKTENYCSLCAHFIKPIHFKVGGGGLACQCVSSPQLLTGWQWNLVLRALILNVRWILVGCVDIKHSLHQSQSELLSDVSEINYHVKIGKSWIIDLN